MMIKYIETSGSSVAQDQELLPICSWDRAPDLRMGARIALHTIWLQPEHVTHLCPGQEDEGARSWEWNTET